MRSILLLLPKYFFLDFLWGFQKSFASSQKHALSSRFARVVRKCRRTISGVLGQMYAGYTEDGLNWKIKTNGFRKYGKRIKIERDAMYYCFSQKVRKCKKS